MKKPIEEYNKEINLEPISTDITREIDGTKYTFAVDGFRDKETGEVYYKASSIAKVEKQIRDMNAMVDSSTKAILLQIKKEVAREINER